MNLWLRLLYRVFTLRFRSAIAPLGPCVSHFRVWPHDLDVFGHVNNGRYLTWLDLARLELMWRTGVLRAARSRGYYPIIASETVHFRRALTLLQRVQVETRVLGWDERCFYIQHLLTRSGAAVALAVVRARFLSASGSGVSPQQVLALLGVQMPSPALPGWIRAWVEGMRVAYGLEVAP
jgi:acyl-CoA thioesterase FadM